MSHTCDRVWWFSNIPSSLTGSQSKTQCLVNPREACSGSLRWCLSLPCNSKDFETPLDIILSFLLSWLWFPVAEGSSRTFSVFTSRSLSIKQSLFHNQMSTDLMRKRRVVLQYEDIGTGISLSSGVLEICHWPSAGRAPRLDPPWCFGRGWNRRTHIQDIFRQKDVKTNEARSTIRFFDQFLNTINTEYPSPHFKLRICFINSKSLLYPAYTTNVIMPAPYRTRYGRHTYL